MDQGGQVELGVRSGVPTWEWLRSCTLAAGPALDIHDHDSDLRSNCTGTKSTSSEEFKIFFSFGSHAAPLRCTQSYLCSLPCCYRSIFSSEATSRSISPTTLKVLCTVNGMNSSLPQPNRRPEEAKVEIQRGPSGLIFRNESRKRVWVRYRRVRATKSEIPWFGEKCVTMLGKRWCSRLDTRQVRHC